MCRKTGIIRSSFVPVLIVAVAVMFTIGQKETEAESAFTAAGIFSDHMVLQRNAAPRIWGGGRPGCTVTAKIAGHTASARVNKEGRWSLELPSMRAGGPHELSLNLEVPGGEGMLQRITFTDVLIGEVWFTSGQSNMQFGLRGSRHGEEALKEADISLLRLNDGGAWRVSDSDSAAGFSAVSWYFARELMRRLPGVPVGIIGRSRGGTAMSSFLSPGVLHRDPALKETVVDVWDNYAGIRTHLNDLLRSIPAKHRPVDLLPSAESAGYSSFFHQRMEEVFPYTVAGALWYQGESDAWGFSIADAYETKLRALIRDWRELFHNPELPVILLQLPHYEPTTPERPLDPAPWSIVQEVQAGAADDTAGVGLVVSIDSGESNIHPRKKKFFGERAAVTARGMVYGEDITWRGPAFREMKVRNGTVTVYFDHARGLSVAGQDPDIPPTVTAPPDVPHLGFAVAGADRVFHWPEARIEGETVVLKCAEVADPVAVRYSFWDHAPWTLVNHAGLPAGPFRTDDWHWDLLRDLPADSWPRSLTADFDGEGAGDTKGRGEAATGFTRVHTLGKAPAPTEFKISWNSERLRVAFKCVNPEGHEVRAEAQKRDDMDIFADDYAGIIIDADGDGETYYRIVVNPRGSIYDDSGFSGRTIDDMPLFMPSLSITRRQDDAWNGEIAINSLSGIEQWSATLEIPWKSLGRGAPKPGEVLGVQFVRSFGQPDVTYEWTPTGRDRSTGAMMPPAARKGFRQFHSPRRFGRLILSK
ncbi:MAG: sialate O-acetylesterase [Kiritimatiellia bacterium]